MIKPEGIAAFLSPQERQNLNRLTLSSRYVVEGNLAGRHRSPNRGASTEFADHRAYFPGDDPKRLDWKVLGRTDRYFIRRYQDETNLRVYLILDRSGSMGYGSGSVTKYQYACRLAAAIGYVILNSRDSVGLYIYAKTVDAAIGARNSFAHLNNLLKTLQHFKPGSDTDTAPVLHRVAEDVSRRALIVLISDLFDQPAEVVKALAHFRKQHHDVIVFQTLDPMELDISNCKSAEFEDMENGEVVIADPRALGDAYKREMVAFIEQYRQPCVEMNIDYRLVNTAQPVDIFVRAYLEERRRLSR
ncbi:MAG: DUF58 domain-containing protein [bacterium]